MDALVALKAEKEGLIARNCQSHKILKLQSTKNYRISINEMDNFVTEAFGYYNFNTGPKDNNDTTNNEGSSMNNVNNSCISSCPKQEFCDKNEPKG